MTTSAKTCQPKNVKKTKYKMASPISNDRAEAFVGPQAEVSPRFSEVPSERDKRAFELAAKGMTQREIAKRLKISQPTVQRAVKKYRYWFGGTLPEDRGEMVGWSRFRVAVEERRIFLRHQMEVAMEEWHQSRQSVPMKRKRTKLDPAGQQVDGMPVKDIQIDEWVQPRRATAAHLNAAAKRSLELTMLEGGYLGVHKLSCDLAIDTDERDRWDRAVKSYQGTIEELKREVAELEAKLAANSRRVHEAERNARGSDESAVVNQPRGNANPACISQSLMHPTVAVNSSRVHAAERNARVSDESPGVSQPQGNANPACISQSLMHPTPSEAAPQYRWEDSFRQEALDYHCLKFGLPPATTDMATGIPDPFKMSPRLWIERGYPYQIYIDRDIPCNRRNPLDTMGVIKLACHPVVNPEGW